MSEPKLIEITSGLMNVGQVAGYLGTQRSTIYNLSMKSKIPHYHVPPPRGKLLRFKKSEIDAWLENGGCDGSGIES